MGVIRLYANVAAVKEYRHSLWLKTLSDRNKFDSETVVSAENESVSSSSMYSIKSTFDNQLT